MKYKYIAFDEIEEKEIDVEKIDDKRKIKEPITITIEIEIEKSKYIKSKGKYKNPISSKIADLFK